MNINPQFVEITKLIAVLAAVIIGYILTAIFSIIGAFSVGYSIYGFAIQNEFDNKWLYNIMTFISNI